MGCRNDLFLWWYNSYSRDPDEGPQYPSCKPFFWNFLFIFQCAPETFLFIFHCAPETFLFTYNVPLKLSLHISMCPWNLSLHISMCPWNLSLHISVCTWYIKAVYSGTFLFIFQRAPETFSSYFNVPWNFLFIFQCAPNILRLCLFWDLFLHISTCPWNIKTVYSEIFLFIFQHACDILRLCLFWNISLHISMRPWYFKTLFILKPFSSHLHVPLI